MEKLVKVLFRLAEGEWHGAATETMWASEVGPATYRLESSPFHAYGVSYQDVVLAREDDGFLTFVQAVQRGGHSTYRIIPHDPRANGVREGCTRLNELGCSYEEGPATLLAVDVPPTADLAEVYAELERGEAAGLWDFEEAHCARAVS